MTPKLDIAKIIETVYYYYSHLNILGTGHPNSLILFLPTKNPPNIMQAVAIPAISGHDEASAYLRERTKRSEWSDQILDSPSPNVICYTPI